MPLFLLNYFRLLNRLITVITVSHYNSHYRYFLYRDILLHGLGVYGHIQHIYEAYQDLLG